MIRRDRKLTIFTQSRLATTNQIQRELPIRDRERLPREIPRRESARRATRENETRALETYPRDESIGNLPEKNQRPSTPKEPEEQAWCE